MKHLIIALLITQVAGAQITTYKVPITQWGHQANAMVYVPSEHKDSVHKTYPAILFFHGTGESGSDINKIYSQGLPKRIRAGWEPQAVNPITGVIEKFIVIAVQDPGGWSPYPESMKYALQYIRGLSPSIRIDTNRILATGLSAGGQTSLMYALWDSADYHKVAAIVSASPAGLEVQAFNNLPQLGKFKVPTWFWSGTSDGLFTDNARNYTGIITLAGGVAFMQTYTGGHCCWDDLYYGRITRDWKDKKLNMYEWFLAVAPQTGGPVDPPKPERKLITTIKIYDNGDIEKL